MKWIKNPLSMLKNSAVSAAVFTLVISPVAQGSAAKAEAKARVQASVEDLNYNVDKKSIQEYLKFTGLSGKKRISVGEFYSKMRPFYPPRLQRDMDRWARDNRNELMPEFTASTYKDSDGKEHVRLLVSKEGQTFTVSFNPESNAKFVKVNNVYLTKTDLLYHDQAIGKLVYGDSAIKKSLEKVPYRSPLRQSVALSYAEFNRLTPRQRAEYFVRLRYVTENAQRVFKAYYGAQALNEFDKEFYVQWLLGQEAQAAGAIRGAKPGDPCIVSGYISVYGENASCGGLASGTKNLKQQMESLGGGRCTGGSISCNPLVYGYKPDGAAFCVSTADKKASGGIRDATSNFCEKASPLRKGTPYEAEDKKRIIESFLASKGQKVDLKFDKDGKVAEDQYNLVKDYLNELNSYIDRATTTCNTIPLSQIKNVRDEQSSACVALSARKMDLLSYPLAPPLPPPVPPSEKDCSIEKPGSENQNGECICPPGTVDGVINEDGTDRPACVTGGAPLDEAKKECNKDEKRDEKTGECVAACAGWCSWGKWVIGGLLFAGIFGAIWAMTSGGHKHKNKQTPYDPCPPVGPCMPPPVVNPSPTVEPPPVVVAPSVTPPVVIPSPVVTPFTEPSSGTSTSTSGGVR